jgi:hypothetical protein
MYKKRLSDWKSRKYCTQAQKKKIISRLAMADLENQSATTVELNGKPIKTQRLYRRVQRKGERFSIASHPDYAVRRAMKHYLASIRESGQIERHILQQSTQSRDIEQFLRSAHRYYTWYNTQTEFKYQIDSCISLFNFDGDLHTAFTLLNIGSATAFACLNRSCAEINSILKQQPFQFLYWFVLRMARLEQQGISSIQIWRTVLRFISSSSSQILGISHPVTECAHLISSNAERGDCLYLIATFSQLLIDIVQAMPESWEKPRLLSELAEDLTVSGINNQVAERILETLEVAQSQSTHPTKAERRVLGAAIRDSFFRHEFTKCEDLCRKQIEWSTEIIGRPEGDIYGSGACEYLGSVYYQMERDDESERFYRLALEGYIADTGDSSALRILKYLEKELKARGKHEEVAELREEYDHLLAEFEEWKLEPAQLEL